MGLGKFNYANRKNEGPKMGAIVAKDLRKRVAQSSKEGKGTLIPLEICLAGKAVTDEGLAAACDGLLDAIDDRRWGNTSLVLEELNLSHNKLTVRGLETLAPVIRLSSGALKDLDLSGNNISINSEDDARAWQVFLGAFRDCFVLRRLDLSGNDLGSSLAFEVLVREYARQCEYVDAPVNRAVEQLEVLSITDSPKKSNDRSPRSQPRSSVRNEHIITPNSPTTWTTERFTGLRSVAYIVLSNVKMTDTGALWLSHVIEYHRMPDHLMICPPKPGPMEAVLEDYHRENGCDGIVYKPNKALTILGRKILESAELARRANLKTLEIELQDDIEYQADEDEENGVDGGAIDYSRMKKGPSQKMSDLRMLRRKFQRNAIELETPVQLWKAALKTLVLTRVFLPARDVDEEVDIKEEELYKADSVSNGIHTPALSQTSDAGAKSDQQPVDDQTPGCNVLAKSFMPQPPAKPTFSSVVSGSHQLSSTSCISKTENRTLKRISKTDNATIELESTPSSLLAISLANLIKNETKAPKLGARTNSDKASEPLFSDSPPMSATSLAQICEDRDMKKSFRVAKTTGSPILGKLSENTLSKIIELVADPQQVLSEAQRKRVLGFGQMGVDSLRKELEWKTKGESHQIWHVLDECGCTAYEMGY